MKVAIPATIDLAKLLKDQGLSKTRMKSMRDKIHYFLSLLVLQFSYVYYIKYMEIICK
jgi:hypothetical protein